MHLRHKAWLLALALLLATGAASCRKDTTTTAVPQSAEQATSITAGVDVAQRAPTAETAATTARPVEPPAPSVTPSETPATRPATPAPYGPALAATVQALATQDASALPDKLARDALQAAGFHLGLGAVNTVTYEGGVRVLNASVDRIPQPEAEEAVRRAVLTLAQASAARSKPWDGIQIMVEGEYGGLLYLAALRGTDVDSWRRGRINDDGLVSQALALGQTRRQQLEPPTPNPAAVSTAAAAATAAAASRDPAAVKITLADLPSDFQELSKEAIAAIPSPFNPRVAIQNRFGFTTLTGRTPQESVAGLAALLPDQATVAEIDALIEQPDAWLDRIASALAGRGKVNTKKVLGGFGALGDRVTGFQIVFVPQGAPSALEVSYVLFRRGSIACLVYTVYDTTTSRGTRRLSVADLARKLDDRAVEFQKNLVLRGNTAKG